MSSRSPKGRAAAALFCLLVGAALLGWGCHRNGPPTVIVYTSQDEVFAEPILREFERQTGIQVRPVYDSEAVKTVGLVNRLLTERNNPQCDVFWNNEEFRTRQLAARAIFRPTNGWTHLGYRTRRLVVNTNLLPAANAPRTFRDATNTLWRGKVALAYPLFGTTATHFLALRQRWGDQDWQQWCRALAANQPFLVDGNSVVVKQVSRGEAWFGFTDSDDIAGAQREGFPVAPLPVTEETLFVPNTVGVIRNCPHPEAAQRLFEFLSDPKVSQKLVELRALEGATLDPARAATGLQVDWDKLLRDLDTATEETKQIFLR
jgi:iron(III) transport system substrate-binding protein